VVTLAGGMMFVGLAIAAAVAYTRRDDRQYLIVAAIAIVGIAISLVSLVSGDAVAITVFDLPLAVVLFVVAAEAVGLPPSASKTLGVGFRSREEYDRRLAKVIAGIEASLSLRRTAISRTTIPRRPANGPGSQQDCRLRALRAPSVDWQRLTDGYAEAYEAWYDMLDSGSLDQHVQLRHESSRCTMSARAFAPEAAPTPSV
jgi:hypothetical protein